MLGRGGGDHFGDLAAFRGIAEINGVGPEVQLQANHLATAAPEVDLGEGRVIEGIDGEESHQAIGVLLNLRRRKFIFPSCPGRHIRGFQMQRGQAVEIGAGEDYSLGDVGLIEGAYRVRGENGGRVIGGEALADLSYRAKGINKFTFVNLRLLGSNRSGGIFSLAASFQQVHAQQPQVAVQLPFRGDVS
jgi:hypothetical protein